MERLTEARAALIEEQAATWCWACCTTTCAPSPEPTLRASDRRSRRRVVDVVGQIPDAAVDNRSKPR